ncbi:hypothetical protein [Anaerocolumna chitinilytica]|uniref:Uncharacterized protein n=1 Tax=Anaerocolumna chitinilytica TaxID=1727145 RepID=A0A7I8DQE9_9FIRM|nr:hypothetical protein [Anaerocolumna chitinilytica]BCK00513.1 hypothetical protein bsdcttw_35530 [Anaerocolumna chitinilytica]
MMLAILIFIIGICFLYIKHKAKTMDIDDRTKKVTVLLSRLLMIAPLIGVVIFTILLTTLLHGRFLERSTHALILFVLWMFVTSFYVEILKHKKNKFIMLCSMAASIVSIAVVVMLTPLERYNTLLYRYFHGYIAILGFGMLALFYIGHLTMKEINISK